MTMKARAYYKRTEVGTFWIRSDHANKWTLAIDDGGNTEVLGSYNSPEVAADDVCTQHTGWDDWDNPIRSDAPRALSEWEIQALR